MKNITSREKRLDIAMLIGAAAAVLLAIFTDFSAQCEQLYDSAFRLHIMANSDSAEDQRVKNELRDYILDEFGSFFTSCKSKETAKKAAERSLPLIEARTREFLAERGCPYDAYCTVTRTEFPTRMYGDVTLPAGSYDALRIVLGSGSGHNWWCVLYPSVCVEAASPASPFPRRELYEKEKTARKRTADSIAAERGGLELRFAVYDLLRGLFGFGDNG